jgi:hypothetical protein
VTLRILVAGSRDWTDRGTIRRAMILAGQEAGVHPQETTVVHGGCPTGADQIADELAREFGCRVEKVEADWGRWGKAAGPVRNQVLVDRGADKCLAFPLGESRGTRDCMRRAAAAGIPVRDYGVPTGPRGAS